MDKRKRGNYAKGNIAENAYVTIAKLLPPVKTLLETIVAGQKDFLEIEERKAKSMEDISRYLKKLAGSGNGESDPIEVGNEAPETPTDILVSEDMDGAPAPVEMTAVDIIRDLRGQGLSYDKIARQLDMDNIPTPSGRGKWRGQAVSKLLNK
jgi:hypothetical protein